ncbi:hypothetical protein EDC04DRAFT_3142689 [Pisolithus marmoratus]|nr:hypothetical protein EDC04DRAFT_3142689 [Pisolithus marmoratus]
MSHSSATISAIAVFENGCQAEGMSCIFDAQIFLGKEKPLLAALQYFNHDNQEFSDVGFYFITACVAAMESGANISHLATCPEETEYDLVGEVVKLIQIKVPDLPQGRDKSLDDHQPIDICDIVDLAQLPYIEICGIAETVDDLAGMFEVQVHQYVAPLRSPVRDGNSPVALSGSPRFRSIMPVECVGD